MEKAEERLFSLRNTSLSHTPGTESGARKLDEAFREEYNRAVRMRNFGYDYFLTNIEEAEGLPEVEEGHLIYVPD